VLMHLRADHRAVLERWNILGQVNDRLAEASETSISVETTEVVETSISPRGTKAPPTLAGIARIRVEVYRGNLLISRAGFDTPCLIRIGALKSSEICLHDQEGSVARMHAAIEASADTVRLIDFGSASGTKLAGEEIDKNAELKDGDEIEIRGYRIVVHFDRAGGGGRDDKNKGKVAPSEEPSACSDDHCFDDTTCAMGWADKADCDRMPSAAATSARPASYAWLSRRKSGPGVKPLVYVAGPYTADTDEQRLANIAAAQAWGAKVIDAGGIPVVPHNMSEGIAGKGDAEFWYTATLELMLRCDVVLLMPRAGESIGARAEEEAAHESGMPVIDAGKLPPGVRLADCISGIAVATVDPHAAARRRRDRDAGELKRIKDLRSQIAGLRAEVAELRQLRHVKGGDRCN
ncbi:MAG TPA: FHA domain-containing protein, partial [Acidimicrobiia bacterium]